LKESGATKTELGPALPGKMRSSMAAMGMLSMRGSRQ
jgi:hypothetical protein